MAMAQSGINSVKNFPDPDPDTEQNLIVSSVACLPPFRRFLENRLSSFFGEILLINKLTSMKS